MKAIPFGFYKIEIVAENDAEKVFLRQFLAGFSSDTIEQLSKRCEISIDLEDCCVKDDKTQAKDLSLKEAMDDSGDGAWGLVDKISINSSGL